MLLAIVNPESNLESLAELLENLLFPILLIELVWLRRRGLLDRNRVKEMFANASSLLIVIPAGVLGFVLWLQLFEAQSSV